MGLRKAIMLSATLAAFLVGGCTPAAPGTSPTPPPVTATPFPAPAPDTTTPTATPAGAPLEFNIYFASHEKMQAAPRTAPAGTTAVLRVALQALLQGPSASERAGGLGTMIPKGTVLRGVTITANVATIDLSKSFASGGGTLSMTDRLAQVVFTATQFHGVDAVTFRLDGKPVKVLGGEGIMIDTPQTRAMFEDASPAILVESPAWGATLEQGAVVRGTANVFEAVFRLQIRDSTGKVVLDRTVQATSGTGTRGTWKATAPLIEAKAGAGTLRVFTESAKDGRPIDVVTVPVILRQ